MKLISAFDVIGPNMIGPSSSHTAGALRIAELARKLLKGEPVSARFILYGSFAHTYRGHGTDRALAAGIMGFQADDERIPNSLKIAKERGVDISFEINTEEADVHPNTVDIDVTTDRDEHMVIRRISTGGGRAELSAIDGVSIRLSGEYSTILVKQLDTQGVITHIAGCLSENNINIAFMHLYREEKGRNAYTIIEADETISESVVHQIEEHPSIFSAILIE